MTPWAACLACATTVVLLGAAYLKVGQWEALGTGPATHALQARPTEGHLRLPQDAPGLVAHLRQAPGDIEAWRQLATKCEEAGLLTEAVAAYRSWTKLTSGDADTLARYAVTLAMSTGQGLTGEPESLILRALRQDPNHVTALGLAAEAALERRDDQAALRLLQRLEAALPAGSPQREPLQQRMALLTQRMPR